VAATALGIPETDVTTALKSGQSLAAIAKAHGVDPQKVIDALVADAKSELAAAVTSGKLTQTQADQQTTNLTQQITDQVNRVGGRPGR
jgi:urease accessory protein UreF